MTAPFLVGNSDPRSTEIVMVAFSVTGLSAKNAIAEVTDRLEKAKLLMFNDSTDWERGTADPISTYAVLDVSGALAESL